MFKFIHCADLHLDSPLRGLSSLTDAPEEEIRSATRKALENLVDLAIMENVSFLVIAGDVYDGDWDDYSTGLFFNRCMVRLGEAGIRVFLIRGNHDAQSQISKSLTLPDNVRELSTAAPETVALEDLQVAIHGQGFANRAVTENLAARYPPPVPGFFNVGLLHTCAEGQVGHEPYAPCRIADLAQMGYQYWALGHIHKRQVLWEHPPIVFSGNIQGRHIREEGEKGCTLVTVNERQIHLEHRNLDVLRWYTCTVDLTDAANDEDFVACVQQALGNLVDQHPNHRLAVRVVCQGSSTLHGTVLADAERYVREVQNAAYKVAGESIWIEKVQFHTHSPVFREGLEDAQVKRLGGALLETFAEARSDKRFLSDFLHDIVRTQTNLRDYLQRADALVVETPEDVQKLLEDAQSLLLTALEQGGLK